MNDTIKRAELAKRIITDPMYMEAMQILRDQTRDLFFDIDPSDSAARERLHMMDRARQQFQQVFETIITIGEIDRNVLLEEERRKSMLADLSDRVRRMF